ncbi:uncharacterized protein A4U43_C04F12810 [Asparagus officinalis]|uniref:Uncharacterized protein n=1 Tax=Asparagus officinalis TaxID=4686 RepID=A0A5P1F0E1_ASPOF|nr:uncharacterized protein A4U43_C04F12810 [Asparagus officinalis]
MVSVLCNYTSLASRLSKLPLLPNPNNKPHNPISVSPCRFKRKTHHHRHHHHLINAISNPNDNSNNSSQQQLRTLFPGGFKRPKIKVPTVVLKLSSEEILSRDQDSVAEAVNSAVSKGVGVVVLKSGKGDDESGGLLYEAACVFKSVVGDKAYLLIRERVDIDAAIGTSGVLLSDQGDHPLNLN